MLNNLTNFFNLITGRMIKKEPEKTDLLILGTKDPRYDGGYKPTGITMGDFVASLPTPTIVTDGTTITGEGTDVSPLKAVVPYADEDGNLIIADSSTNTVDVGPGASQQIQLFSGMLLVNDHYDGGLETWIAGGGDTICVGATNTGGGPVGSTLTMNGSGYEWTNASNLVGPFTFTVIKTRLGS